MMRDKINAYVALGSNEGDRLANLNAAESAIASASGIYLDRSSPTYESPAAEPCEGQPDFLNRVLAIETWLTPRELLATCLEIEKSLGRDRAKEGDPHVMDVDILLFGDLILGEADLIIPHEALARRPFFLKPLADLTGDIILPGHGVSINTLLAGLAPYELTVFENKY